MVMPSIAALLLLIGDESLIERLDHESPEVRDEAAAELARQGARAMPDLERALAHSSLEVRSRAADLLMRLPEYSWRLLSREQPLLEPLWNALIEGLVRKQPVPAALCKALGWGDENVVPLELGGSREIAVESHPPEWIARRLMEEGTRALWRVAGLHGVEGRKTISRSEELLLKSCAIPDLPERLARFGADDVALEEIHGAILQGRETCLAEVFNVMSREDWDLFLRFLVHLRRRPGAEPARAPESRAEALERVSKGPWAAGIAGAIHRATEEREEAQMLLEQSEEPAQELRGPWRHLEQLHLELGRLDSDLARRRYDLVRNRHFSGHEPDLVFLILREKP